MSVFNKLMRAGEGKILRKLHRIADQVNSIEEDFVNLTDAGTQAELALPGVGDDGGVRNIELSLANPVPFTSQLSPQPIDGGISVRVTLPAWSLVGVAVP